VSASRLDLLREMLQEEPDDAFTRYALAMELRGLGRGAEALGELARVLAEAPEYVATYYQYGRLLHETGHTEQAIQVVTSGIEEAGRQGEAHARGELEDLLRELEG
jgi:tetratricopeptide (TPR) repeat protein